MQDNKSRKETQNKPSFVDDKFLVFVYKKTERIAVAVYLITGLIKDEEPLKWKLRHSALTLLGDVLPLKNNPLSSETRSRTVPSASELISLLDVGRSAHLISDMNYSVIEHELESLVKQFDRSSRDGESAHNLYLGDLINPEKKSGGGEIIESALPDVIRSLYTSSERDVSSKGHLDLKDKKSSNFQSASVAGGKVTNISRKERSGSAKDRRSKIVEFLKGKRDVTVSEISSNIGSVGEKTIQRDLGVLARRGVVRKEGTRRWTKYSLA